MNSANTYNVPPETNVMPSTARPVNSRILSANAVRVSKYRAPVGPALEEACPSHPRVETRLRNGAISEIVITCGCGQQTVIECDYSDAKLKS